MKYFSSFSGIGGFELGIKLAYELLDNRPTRENQQKVSTEKNSSNTSCKYTWEPPTCVGYSEIDKYAIQTYQKHFPEHKNYGDITKINEQELPDFDLLVGGFPCQSFSIAGKRKGFEDTRGTMFFELARILRAKQPRLFVFENVKGLLSHDNGQTFSTIIATLDELGYDCQWQVLNSKNHGVPQNRERVFIIGHLRGTSRPEVFPIGGTNQEDTQSIKRVGKLNVYNTDAQAGKIYDTGGVSPTVSGQRVNSQGWIKQINNPTHSNDSVYGEDEISPTLNTMQGGNRQPFVATGEIEFVGSLNPITRKGTEHQAHLSRAHKQPARVHSENGINPALSAGETQGRYHTLTNDMKIRRLTPIECERLQGFPDGWTIGSDTQRYKQCGNAVTVNVIKDLFERIIK